MVLVHSTDRNSGSFRLSSAVIPAHSGRNFGPFRLSHPEFRPNFTKIPAVISAELAVITARFSANFPPD